MKIKQSALETAVKSLAMAEQSEKHLSEKLIRKGYSKDEVEEAINRLKERDYLREEDGCARKFQMLYESSRKSTRQIIVKLMAKGYSKELAESFLPPRDEDFFLREKKAALASLKAKYDGKNDEEKMRRYLYRQGFDTAVGKEAVREFLREEEEGA